MRSLDLLGLRALRTHLHQPPVEAAVRRFSALGEHGGVWLAISLAGAAAAPARRPAFLRAAATIAGAYVSNQTVKIVVRRRRPELPDLPQLTNTHSRLSYP